ncbi:hypothetical protein HYALB_00000706 [Hymenoscyphus albidus]|uniref:ribonuclease H n=1 Tax=Hymenoscyphus albidus TaxID=595503 RepID=A0A9N9LV22_9HELO|nr:hypothetical protein HYALB_00000706 [Hymenoscyphus albidus]
MSSRNDALLPVPTITLEGMKIRQDIPYTNRLFIQYGPPGVTWSQVYNPVTTLTSLRPNAPANVKFDVKLELIIWLIICVDGQCKNIGTPHARAAYGMYFGPHSPYNRCSMLPQSVHKTNGSAELFAVMTAVCFVKDQSTRPISAIGPLKKVVIQTDSSYVVECLTKNIWTWQDNGYQNARGIRTANLSLIYDIHHLLEDAKRHVARVKNQGADRLVELAFDWESQFTFRTEEPAFPTNKWKHASKYAKELSPSEVVPIHTILSRLEWPLPLKRENRWIDSIISYMIRGNLLLEGRADFPALFQARFGKFWRTQIARERDKITEELAYTERAMNGLPPGAGTKGSREWIGYHEKLAQLGTLLARISEGRAEISSWLFYYMLTFLIEELDDGKHSHIV